MNLTSHALKSAVLIRTSLVAIMAVFSPLFTITVYAFNNGEICHIDACVETDIFGVCTHRVNRSGRYTWPQGRTTMYISTTSYPTGSAEDSRLQNAMAHWNDVKGSNFTFSVDRDTDGNHDIYNGINEIYSADASSASFDDEDTLAVTLIRRECSWDGRFIADIVEADIAFNARFSWSTTPYSYSNPSGSPINFEGVALHELGHVLGLEHEDSRMATMNSLYPNSGPFGHNKEWDPFGDDRLGVRSAYPDQTTEIDIAASPLKRTGAGSSYLVSSPSSALRGSLVDLEYTFSNLSTSALTFDIGFYLSGDSSIEISDTLLGGNTGSAPPGGTGTFTKTLTIPSSTTPGTYYLGFIVDPDNEISEDNETNNSQEMPRTITITAADDHGSTPGEATSVGLTSSTSGEIEAGGDRDYFRIALSQAGTLTLQTAGSTDTFGTLTHQGATVASDDDGGEGNNFLISEQLNAGTYFIEVRGYNGSTTGRYTLLVAFQPAVSNNLSAVDNPQPNSVQTGANPPLFGWKCVANGALTARFNGGSPFPVLYGSARGDTQGVCGDDGNNGFVLPINWNILGAGLHKVELFDNGAKFGEVTFRVVTFGTEFLLGAQARTTVSNFPSSGKQVEVSWDQAIQNFRITGQDANAILGPNPFDGDAAAIEDGAAFFQAVCTGYCHVLSGGDQKGKWANLFDCEWKNVNSEKEIFEAVFYGLPNTPMPAYKDVLPDETLWQILAYVKSASMCKDVWFR